MARNMLAIIQAAALELGIPGPISVTGNPDTQTQQFLALVNRDGSELAAIEGGWTSLRGEQLITWTIGIDTYAFPSDFAYYVQDTTWDRSTRWRISGPMSETDWQVLKSGYYPSGIYARYRIMNGKIRFDPVPASADTIAIEYVSSNWCQSALGVTQSQFVLDTDTPLIPDDLLVLGLKWRFLAAKGFNYAEEKAAYDLAITRLHPRDRTTENLHLGATNDYFLNMGLLPAGNWPGR